MLEHDAAMGSSLEQTQSAWSARRGASEHLGRPSALDDGQQAPAGAALQAVATVSAVAKQFDTSRQRIMRVRDAAVEAA